jgi:GT2 family glycosyltransferase
MYKLRIQMVVYKNSIPQLRCALDSVIAAAKLVTSNYQIVMGSNSCDLLLNRNYTKLVEEYSQEVTIKIHVSQENIGHGAMHNRLFFKEYDQSELLLIINPDGVIGPTSLLTMVNSISPEFVGAVEPRQLPFEHPKKFDLNTGETSWTSGACLLTKSEVFEKIGGFDERFFLHCDDVDLSWRIRNEGLK